MKVLVTGGSGFIGTNMLDLLIGKSYEVVSVDIKRPRNVEQTPYWVQCDINDYQKLFSIFSSFNPDYVIHLAARTDLDGASLSDYNTNIGGVDNLCKVVSQTKTVKSIIFASSMLVCKIGHQPQSSRDFSPTTVYGESKVCSEKIVLSYRERLPCHLVFRPTSIWGPWFGEPYANFFNVVLSGKYFHPGRESYYKTYGYVENACFQLLELLLNTATLDMDEIYYIGDSEPMNISRWADQILVAFNGKINPVAPLWLFRCAAYFGDLLKYFGYKFPMTSFRLRNMTTNNVLDVSRASSLIGVNEVPRKMAIKRTIDWMRF